MKNKFQISISKDDPGYILFTIITDCGATAEATLAFKECTEMCEAITAHIKAANAKAAAEKAKAEYEAKL